MFRKWVLEKLTLILNLCSLNILVACTSLIQSFICYAIPVVTSEPQLSEYWSAKISIIRISHCSNHIYSICAAPLNSTTVWYYSKSFILVSVNNSHPQIVPHYIVLYEKLITSVLILVLFISILMYIRYVLLNFNSYYI